MIDVATFERVSKVRGVERFESQKTAHGKTLFLVVRKKGWNELRHEINMFYVVLIRRQLKKRRL